MKPSRSIPLLLLAAAGLAMKMEAADDLNSEDITATPTSINWATVTPKAHVGHPHGLPILEQSLAPQERLYWTSYNTTTYFTLSTPYKSQLWAHLFLIIISFAFVYPFVMVLNNLDSNWYLPALTVQAIMSIVSVLCYSIFIHNVPDLYPNMAYSRMITGLFVLTLIQYASAIIYVAKRWLEGGPRFPAAAHYVAASQGENENDNDNEESTTFGKHIPLSDLGSGSRSSSPGNGDRHSPSSTLYDRDSFDIDGRLPSSSGPMATTSATDEEEGPFVFGARELRRKGRFADRRDSILEKVFQYPLIERSVHIFGFIATVIFKILNYGMFAYFLVLIPTGIAGLNLLGKANRVFNLLAHFIKGGVFVTLGIVSLSRYLGAFTRMGGAWNYSYVTEDDKRHSLWLRIQPRDSMITFEMIESSLILFYGSTNIFLEHLAAAGGPWAAKDLQHVSIAFMYIGAGLCGVITEVQLQSWRKSKFLDQVGTLLESTDVRNLTPGFSPNPFPVFTIFWTGLLMSQHAQASELSTTVHVQWGSLLTYGSLFRACTFLFMTYYPLKDRRACFRPGRPLTELVTSFCLLCGGFVFMESTDQVIEAMEYRGLTPMFTLNVSVGCTALVMAWIMVVFSFKNWLKRRMYGDA
ncbi:DEKNAAC101346 [Brettanomyces naardenensis]|uniref:DEKNAAC101346 n=1 Tax=Brettanomyces naardenensis TaxID=13370 RepID=A0A448YHM1_BRENA|nr:DEKNAAC101346 [Brettanomyces naardenensis]